MKSTMRLAVFNGSPRGHKSNTSVLLKHFLNGFQNNGGELESIDYLIQEKNIKEQVANFKSAENILLAFPLYVDSVPGMVKKFIEEIGNFNGEGKRILFFVHSGFPEGIHSEGVINYMKFLVKRWKMNLVGIILKPGSEGIRMRPEGKNTQLFHYFETLGSSLATRGTMDEKIINKLKQPYKLPAFVLFIIRLLKKTSILNKYWDTKLRENNAFENRFARPLNH